MISIHQAIQDLENKKPVIIFDADNENEGDLVIPSEIITTEWLTFMLNECKGVICVTLTKDQIDKLQIPIFQKKGNSITGQTNFVYPVDHKDSLTGISSADRLMIINELISDTGNHENIVIPGHQNVLRIAPGGLKNRQGHTESSSELVRLAGYKESATICEIIDKEGVPMRKDAILEFGQKHNINVVLLSDIYNYHLNNVKITPSLKVYKNPFHYLNGKTVVLTGGSSGIGANLKQKLQDLKCNVIDFSRRNSIDITDYKHINDFIEDNIDTVDILINCAGHIEEYSVADMSLEAWNTHINVNLTAVFNLTHQLLPKFNKNGGSILNVSSPSAKKVRVNWSAYCCSKAALSSFSLNCAEEFKDRNIMVNVLSPTKTNSPMIKKLFPDIPEDSLIDPAIISNNIINIICSSFDKKTTGVIYEVTKN